MTLQNFGYVVDGQLAGLAHPGSDGRLDESLRELRDLGFTALVSLDETGIPPAAARTYGIDHRHLPVADYQPPTMAQAEEFVAYVADVLGRGGQVAVHCMAGLGRTGTMLAAYLISTGLSPAEAVARIRERRPDSVESESQHGFLDEFARSRSD